MALLSLAYQESAVPAPRLQLWNQGAFHWVSSKYLSCFLHCRWKYLHVGVDSARHLVHIPKRSDAKEGNGTTAMVKLTVGLPSRGDPVV